VPPEEPGLPPAVRPGLAAGNPFDEPAGQTPPAASPLPPAGDSCSDAAPPFEPVFPASAASAFAPAAPSGPTGFGGAGAPVASPHPAAEVPPNTPAQQAAGPGEAALLAAFLDGAGLADVRLADPAATMRALGEAFRSMVAGVRAVLIARASVKSEFRIEQTMIQARGNNPLKFSAGDDDALVALLGAGRRTDMTAAVAVADALKDIRLHELASMAAMQSAVRVLLDGLDPARLRAQAEQGGGLSVLPAQRKARAWDAYEALYTNTVQALSDDFDSVFGKAFARAYEQAMQDVSAKERR
jgi:type VI secretion system FHA domain protein